MECSVIIIPIATLLPVALGACTDSSGGAVDAKPPRGSAPPPFPGLRDVPLSYRDGSPMVQDAARLPPPPPARDAQQSMPAVDAAPDAGPDGGPECRLNSDCPPGLYCADAGACQFDCREDRDCPDGRCVSGLCEAAPPDPVCSHDGECDPPATICESGRCVDGCGVTGCPAQWTCSDAAGRCEPTGNPPFDCRRGDRCPDGEPCDGDTGRCRPEEPPPPPEGRLGSACERDADCGSGICMSVTPPGGARQWVCTEICCSELDCEPGFGCLNLDGVRFCMPSGLFPAGYTFDAIRGQGCGAGGRACQSAICNVGEDQCVGVCCTDQDCAPQLCRWRLVGDHPIATCGGLGPILDLGTTGDPCTSELHCLSGVCVPVAPNRGVCADLCCRHWDCPGNTMCGQVASGSSLVTACVPADLGEIATGERCGDDRTCQSGHCVEGLCAEPCCTDEHCSGATRCLPRNNGEGYLIRVCALPIED